MRSVILAGGEGTRLRPLTCDLPKPLVPVCGKPVLAYILELLGKAGCTEAAVAVRYKGERIEEFLGDGRFGGLRTFISAEDRPLGTAGCVKKAASEFGEDFIVISGDAMCDFDLAALYEHHIQSGAAATIAVISVDDPREYGVILGENGTVTGFCEKPSFVNCRSDLVNTGIYVISPEVLELVDDDISVDFAKDVFPKMLKNGMKLCYHEQNGYWCDIGDIAAYKRCTADLINGRIRAVLPEREKISGTLEISRSTFIAKGAYFSPKALAAGCTSIGSGAYISEGAKLNNAIVMDGAFVGEDATLNDCIVCCGAKIGTGAAVYENAVAGEGAVIGEHAVIKSGVRIWNNKRIAKGVTADHDVKYGNAAFPEMGEDGIIGATNTVITPEFAVKVGCALAKISDTGIAVSCAEGTASKSIMNAVLSGISSSGKPSYDCGAVPLTVLAYSGELLGADIIVHISSRERTKIMIYSAGILPLKRSRERIFQGAVSRGEYMTAGWEGFGAINIFDGAEALYVSELERLTGFSVPYDIRLVSGNSGIRRICKPFAGKISGEGEKLTITVSESGETAEISAGDIRIDSVSLTLIVCAHEARLGNDISLPYSFPHTAETAAEQFGKSILRYYASSMDDSDEEARKLAVQQIFMRDGFILAIKALKSMRDMGMTPAELLDSIPKSSTAGRFIRVNCPPQRVLDRLKAVPEENEGAVIAEDGERVFLRPDKRGTGIFLYAESFGTETAASLCDRTEKMIKNAVNSLRSKE